MSSIPFQLPDIHGGFTEIKGLLYLDEEFLVLEIETALIGEFNKKQQVIKVEPAALADIRLERGVIKDRLCIRPKRRELLEVTPGKYLGELQLKLWRKYRERAEQLVAQVQERSRKRDAV